jgi:hypothetical protein
MTIRNSLFLALSLSLAACGKGGDGGGASTKLALDKLNLQADVPAGTKADAAPVGSGLMLMGPGLVVQVDAASETRPLTVEDAQAGAKDYTPVDLKTEKLADGWVLTFANKGSAGENFFVQVRREIAGKPIWCETTASTPDQAKAALAVCKSLAPKA